MTPGWIERKQTDSSHMLLLSDVQRASTRLPTAPIMAIEATTISPAISAYYSTSPPFSSRTTRRSRFAKEVIIVSPGCPRAPAPARVAPATWPNPRRPGTCSYTIVLLIRAAAGQDEGDGPEQVKARAIGYRSKTARGVSPRRSPKRPPGATRWRATDRHYFIRMNYI